MDEEIRKLYLSKKGSGNFSELLGPEDSVIMRRRYLSVRNMVAYIFNEYHRYHSYSVRDFGCGSGMLYNYLLRVDEYYGVEPLEHLAEKARKAVGVTNLIEVATIDEMSFKEVSVGVCAGVLATTSYDKVGSIISKCLAGCRDGFILTFPIKGTYTGKFNSYSPKELSRYFDDRFDGTYMLSVDKDYATLGIILK